jgi:pantoate ligase/cytidylate kinase
MGKLFTTVAGLRCFLELARSQSKSSDRASPPSQLVGLVPTMGALHAGHGSLIRRARRECDRVMVSIFVNPLQFAPDQDFDQYPRNLAQDRQYCDQLGVDAIFAPTATELLGQATSANTTTTDRIFQVVPPDHLTILMEGVARPGHFAGVTTIVTKLLHIVQPDRAYFGQKDAQQLAILRQMALELNFPVQIISCPIVRAADGLALSSRNQYLDPAQRQAATVLYRSLQAAHQAFNTGMRKADLLKQSVLACLQAEPLVRLDYVELVDASNLKPLAQIAAARDPAQNQQAEDSDFAENSSPGDRAVTDLAEPGGAGATFSGTALLAIAAYVGTTRLIDNILLRDRKPIVAIDGPAGAGKSTVTRAVAQRLNLLFIDTGAMYRAITLATLQSGLAPRDSGNYAQIAEITARSQIELLPAPTPEQPQLVKLNGVDITAAIRSPEVTAQVSAIASQPYVRQILTEKQRQIAKSGGVVMEGRDIGTFVLPDAEVKIFLTASVEERSQRRYRELIAKGDQTQDLATIAAAIQARDHQDSNRAVAPLCKADDAIEVDTDGLSIEAVIDRILAIYAQPRSPIT